MSLESVRGANEDRMGRIAKVAFTDMTLLVGPEMAVENVLEQLQQGACTYSSTYPWLLKCYAL